MAFPLIRRTILAALLCAASAATSAAAQSKVDVTGRVVDARTQTPLPNALIEIPSTGRRVVTDTAGRFELKQIAAGSHRWKISRLGYASWDEDVEAEEGDVFTVPLLARPMLLQGITVVSSRFRERRAASGVAVHALERDDILQSAGTNALDVVSSREGLTPMACPLNRVEVECAYVRGELTPIRVFVDDQPAPGGLEELRMYVPQDLYLVETYAGGQVVRVYTTWYAEQVARGRKMLGAGF